MFSKRRDHLHNDSLRSPYIFERRRNLFPPTTTSTNEDSELGQMCPLNSSDSDDDDDVPKTPKRTPESLSSLMLSPQSQSYTTPNNDTSSNNVMEKEQRRIMEESKSQKRKANSPGKCSKVRTALFPAVENAALPTKSFYSNHQQENHENKDRNCWRSIKLPPIATKINRNKHKKFVKGEINNGVRHKIRKPNRKPVKIVKKLLKNGEILNEYLKDLSELKNKPKKATIMYVSKDNERQKTRQVDAINEKILKNSEILNTYIEDLSELTNKSKKGTIIDVNKEKEPQKTLQLCTKNQKSPQLNRTNSFRDANVNEIEESPQLDIIYDFEDEFEPPQANIENILSVLANDSSNISARSTNILSPIEPPQANIKSIVSVLANDSSNISERSTNILSPIQPSQANTENILSVFANDTSNISLRSNNILSPISQMCDVTSGLALTSPRRPKFWQMSSRTSKILSFSCAEKMAEDKQERKLFPVFQRSLNAAPLQNFEAERGEKRSCDSGGLKKTAKRFKALASDQMLLDAGQKRFGLTQCAECNIHYHQGDPNDELQHSNYHNALQVLRFSGWKNEHVVSDYLSEGRIIRILPTDSKIWLKKVEDLMDVVNRDLGCYDVSNDISHSQVYMYIKNRTIAGCAVAKSPQEPGHRMLGNHGGVAICSKESYPIKCGISHIWVGATFRKQGIASALMNAVKCSFFTGYILTNNDVALTSPTVAGAAFAEKYFKTSNYLIYFK